MSIYTLIPIVFIALYLGYWFYNKEQELTTSSNCQQH